MQADKRPRGRTLRLPSVLLQHTTPRGVHYDWLFATPADPAGLLFAARARIPSERWTARGRWRLHQLPPHRRRYLRYQGPLSPQAGRSRGSVRRVDRGWVVCRFWGPRRIVLDLHFHGCRGLVVIRRLGDQRWQAILR